MNAVHRSTTAAAKTAVTTMMVGGGGSGGLDLDWPDGLPLVETGEGVSL